MTSILSRALAATALLTMSGIAPGQEAPTPIARYPRPTAYPGEDHAKVADYLARARAIAGTDLFPDFAIRCISDPRYRQRIAGFQFNGLLDPAKVFDQLYFVGQNAVSAWALDTKDGIVLFDALDSAAEARDIVVPALRQLGLDPARIRYVVITHAHGDHYGGADWLRQQFGAKLVASAEDWAEMDAMRASGRIVGPPDAPPPPTRDIAVRDGEVMRVGGTALRFYVTPGHTPGTLSTIFDVTDNGERHVVAFFGGGGAQHDPALRVRQIASFERFATLAKDAHADVLLANHPIQDGAFEKMELLRYRRPGDANPYVIGADRVQRYYRLQAACGRVALVRGGVDPARAAP